MTKIKKNDFIEIEYTGKIKDEGMIFDTSDEKLAKENDIFEENHKYGPVVVMVGNAQILPGLDKFVEGKEPGNFKIDLKPEEGFGKKDAKLLKLMPKNVFLKQNINPMPSMPINIDGMTGIIKTVSGGRCIVDFNHPLAGKELEYDLKVNRIVTDEKEKVSSIVELQIDKKDFELSIEGEKTVIKLKIGLKKPLKDLLEDMIKKFTTIKKVEFEEEKLKVNNKA